MRDYIKGFAYGHIALHGQEYELYIYDDLYGIYDTYYDAVMAYEDWFRREFV